MSFALPSFSKLGVGMWDQQKKTNKSDVIPELKNTTAMSNIRPIVDFAGNKGIYYIYPCRPHV